MGPNQQVIRETKTWILRCYACFHTTPRMEKKFCPKCGNKTLKRVSVTVDIEGKQQVYKMLNVFSNTKNLAGPHQHKAPVDIEGQALLPPSSKSNCCPSYRPSIICLILSLWAKGIEILKACPKAKQMALYSPLPRL